MNRLGILIAVAALLVALGPPPLLAQDLGVRGTTTTRPVIQSVLSHHAWYFDGRDDARDFPTNGFFPGDFAANPANAAIGAAGIFGSTPEHSLRNYPSQAVIETRHDQIYCGRGHRSYDRPPGTFLGNDGALHRC
jgi:hypothetical protein